MTAATRSSRFIRHRRSIRSPHRPAVPRPLQRIRRGRPPGRPARSCTAPPIKKPVIAKPVRTLAVAIRNSRPYRPPCLKGACTAKPWLGSSFSAAPAGHTGPALQKLLLQGGVPSPRRRTAPLVTDAGRRGRRPLRNPIRKHSVGADASVRRTAPLVTLS